MTVRLSRISLAAVVLALSSGTFLAQNQSARGLFVKSRPSSEDRKETPADAPETVALGYSLFLRDASNKAMRVNPARVFTAGDAIRILVESNASGHLYIFNQEGKDSIRMIYPDLRIRGGATDVTAHVPLLLPSERTAAVGDTDWFVLSGAPQSEMLFAVFATKPVSSWPSGKRLMGYKAGFALRWEDFRKTVRSVVESNDQQVSQDEGEAMTIGEQTSLSRGLKLVRQDPAPSVVKINTRKVDPFVIQIELLRK